MASKVFFDLRKTTSSPSNKSSSDLMARDGYRIDYEAMGAHIVALHEAARNHEINICRVLFDPRLQPYLYKTRYGGYLERNMQIPKRRSWVRHDEHYHVDLVVECKLIEGQQTAKTEFGITFQHGGVYPVRMRIRC